jgi:hypothetical protein
MLNDPKTIARMRDQVGRQYKKNGVPETPELHRVLDLPRRLWEENPQLQELTDAVTRYLKTPTGSQRLRPLQAVALQEVHDHGGLFGPIPVGDGKTLISFLAPVVLEVKRPVLVVPARLRDKTIREFAALGQHWKSHPRLEIVSYEKLSREGGTRYLQKLQPDLLIFDEVHKLKNKDAAVTRKISAWMRTFSETQVIAMSGTITKRSLLDFAHVLRWALPTGCPLPQSLKELEAWAAAVDEIKNYEQRVQTGPGALTSFCTPQEKQQGLAGVRAGLRRRIQETPGVVASKGQSVATSLNISLVLVDEYNGKIKQHAAKLHSGVLPNGQVFVIDGNENSPQALQARWRIMRTLTSGFWYEWDPRPPQDWLDLRSSWKKTVRRLLEEHIPGLESEALVVKAAMQRKLGLGAYDLYEEWRKVRDKHRWNVVPVWEDDCVIQRVAIWAKKHSGLIWVSEVALGQRLQQDLGLPYFHEMGKDDLGRAVETMDPSNGSVVLSVASNSEGRNLQVWNENLVISPPPTGNTWEQLIGRTHRQGQLADEIWVDVLIGCEVEMQCWQQAMKDARYADGLEGPKKLMYATIDQTFRAPPSDGQLW